MPAPSHGESGFSDGWQEYGADSFHQDFGSRSSFHRSKAFEIGADVRVGGRVERLVRCPVGLSRRLIRRIGRSAATRSCHLPAPVPSAPSRSAWEPDSSCRAVYVRASPAGIESRTSLPGDSPLPSTPTIVNWASSSPGLIKRSQLTCSPFRPGLKVGTRWPLSPRATVSCMLVRKPSGARTYASTSMSRGLSSRRRRSPIIGGQVWTSGFAGLPHSRSSELTWMVSFAAMGSVRATGCQPKLSMASILTSPFTEERLMTRMKLWPFVLEADNINGTECTATAASTSGNTAAIPIAVAMRASLRGCTGHEIRVSPMGWTGVSSKHTTGRHGSETSPWRSSTSSIRATYSASTQ